MKNTVKYVMLFIVLTTFGLIAMKNIEANQGPMDPNSDIQPDEEVMKEALNKIQFASCLSDSSFKWERQKFVIAQSDDKSKVFYIRPSQWKNENIGFNIKGDVKYNVDILLEDKKGKTTIVVEKNRPMVSLVKFSYDENYIAFSGGRKLTIFDLKNNKLLFENETAEDFVNYFGWGLGENIIYTEFKRNLNGNIYDMENSNIIMNYEAQQEYYPKEIIDDGYYYCTVQSKHFDEDKADAVNEGKTLIRSKDGDFVAGFPGGRFRGKNEEAFIRVGENEFGISYIPNVISETEPKNLTDEYVYDAKFAAGGKVAYITQNMHNKGNYFTLNIYDPSRGDFKEDVKKIEISGSSFAITPDGRYGFVGGPCAEIIDFESESVLSKEKASGKYAYGAEESSIYEAIIGAFDIFYKYEMTGTKDLDMVDKYYVDTENPSQWANFDMKSIMQEREKASFINKSDYILSIRVDYIDVKTNGKDIKASVRLRAFGQNSSGQSFGEDQSVELVKKEGAWYLTGFSTFPQKKERERALQAAAEYISMAVEGEIGSVDFGESDVRLGQIQFWKSAKAEFAPDIEYADCCKVYVEVDGERGKRRYKMIMERDLDSSWKFKGISDENMSGLT